MAVTLNPDKEVVRAVREGLNLEHLGIPYKNEKGKYQSFLFSKRGYEYVLSQTSEMTKEIKGISDIELKELSDRVMETFAMEDKKNEIYEKLALVEKEGLSIKETLMKVFGEFSDNLDYLSENIDEILANNKEVEKGRVA